MKRLLANKKLLTDLSIILALLLLAGGLYLALFLGREAGGCAVVRVDGVETERHSLAIDGVFPLNGGSNILVIENGEAWLSDADCPDLLCVKQGHVHYNGQTITCLPNRLTVTIEGGESDGVDFVVG
ncbi:MAG: NusG domain II-containing protein [Oscillospiraceae bacterium]|nr:NusG domain II-containing protein [Oscillospiraceae bacterium]